MRPAFHNNVTKRYRGGTARKIWKFAEGAPEAVCLTSDYAGESHSPAVVERPRLLRERPRRHDEPVVDGRGRPATSGSTRTTAAGTCSDPSLDARAASSTRWAPTSGSTTSPRAMERLLPIRLASDFDQLREKWVEEADGVPDLGASAPEGRRGGAHRARPGLRGPRGPGAAGAGLAQAGRALPRRRCSCPTASACSALSDATGELEFVTLPANGVGDRDRPHERRKGPALRGRAVARRASGSPTPTTTTTSGC